jgi:hypothetical protein
MDGHHPDQRSHAMIRTLKVDATMAVVIAASLVLAAPLHAKAVGIGGSASVGTGAAIQSGPIGVGSQGATSSGVGAGAALNGPSVGASGNARMRDDSTTSVSHQGTFGTDGSATGAASAKVH